MPPLHAALGCFYYHDNVVKYTVDRFLVGFEGLQCDNNMWFPRHYAN